MIHLLDGCTTMMHTLDELIKMQQTFQIKNQSINIIIIKMGNTCTATMTSFKLPNLKDKNSYQFIPNQNQVDQRAFETVSKLLYKNDNSFINDQKPLINYLAQMQSESFIDPKFQIKGQRLSKLYDYKRKNMKLYTLQDKKGLAIFQQYNLQFAYLSSVLYFLCSQKTFLRKRILKNEQINQKQTYTFILFCNGEEHTVIVDDIIPVDRDQFEYSALLGKEIWPCLLEKAWCKQIGGYERAKGFSPEECFQEITGIPAYSFGISQQHKSLIYDWINHYQSQNYWLCAVAKSETGILKANQVFLVQGLDDHMIYLHSPYTNFQSSSNTQQAKGQLKITFTKFVQLFNYLIVGFYKKNYVPISLKVKSQKRQEKLYEIYVHKPEQVSIRFTQFFDGYLGDNEMSNYQYSPLVYFQLYDKMGNILNFCQGCERLQAGAHSIYVTPQIFHNLNEGTYFLRLQVDWECGNYMKQGTIVIYASEKNVAIEPLKNEDLKQKINKLHSKTLTLPNSIVVPSSSDQYVLRLIEKSNSILISLQNKTEELIRLELSFNSSVNFRVKYQKLQPNKTVVISLGPKQVRILQILPQQLKQQFKIQPFTVKRLPIQSN